MSQPVMAGFDGSRQSLAAVGWAAREAVLRGVPLRVVHVAPPAADGALEQAVGGLGASHPGLEVRGEHVDGAAAEELLTAAGEAGLLVVGTRGAGGFDGLVVGSVALRLAATVACPVVLVPGEPTAGFGSRARAAGPAAPVVMGFDARRPVGEVAVFAFTAAQARGTHVRAVQAWELPADAVSARSPFVTEEDRATWEDQEVLRLSDALRPWREKYPEVEVRTDVLLLHPAQALLNASQGADLLVVGRRTRPRTAEGRLGPVTHAVLHHARCPVAVVPHTG